MPDLKPKIKDIVKRLDLNASDNQIELFEQYLLLLHKWNKTYNLTAIRNIEEMLEKHLLDSLSIAAHVYGERFLDVGTGAGLPGIPLAILYPQKQFTLLDSNGKKTRFLQQVKTQLQLNNVTVENRRIEQFDPSQKFDAILSRAFASLNDMITGSESVCDEAGCFFAMKGQYPERELQEITKPYKVLPITWLGNQSERHLVIISQSLRGFQ